MRAALVLLAAALAVGQVACSETGSLPPTAGPSIADSADQVMFGVRTAILGQGLKRGELFADTAFVFDEGRRFELRGVNATFFDEQTGAQQGTLVSDEGTYNVSMGTMEGRGNVVVTRSDGAVLTTPQLRYASATNEITSDSAFVLRDPVQGDVEGIGFATDPSFRNLRIQRTIRASARQPVTLPEG